MKYIIIDREPLSLSDQLIIDYSDILVLSMPLQYCQDCHVWLMLGGIRARVVWQVVLNQGTV